MKVFLLVPALVETLETETIIKQIEGEDAEISVVRCFLGGPEEIEEYSRLCDGWCSLYIDFPHHHRKDLNRAKGTIRVFFRDGESCSSPPFVVFEYVKVGVNKNIQLPDGRKALGWGRKVWPVPKVSKRLTHFATFSPN